MIIIISSSSIGSIKISKITTDNMNNYTNNNA